MSVEREKLKERLNETRLKVSQGSRCDVNEELVVEETRALLSELEAAEREPKEHEFKTLSDGLAQAITERDAAEAALRTLREASAKISKAWMDGDIGCPESLDEAFENLGKE